MTGAVRLYSCSDTSGIYDSHKMLTGVWLQVWLYSKRNNGSYIFSFIYTYVMHTYVQQFYVWYSNSCSNRLSLLAGPQCDRVKGNIISLNHEHRLNADKIPDPVVWLHWLMSRLHVTWSSTYWDFVYSPDVLGDCEECNSLIVIPCFNKLSLLTHPQQA